MFCQQLWLSVVGKRFFISTWFHPPILEWTHLKAPNVSVHIGLPLSNRQTLTKKGNLVMSLITMLSCFAANCSQVWTHHLQAWHLFSLDLICLIVSLFLRLCVYNITIVGYFLLHRLCVLSYQWFGVTWIDAEVGRKQILFVITCCPLACMLTSPCTLCTLHVLVNLLPNDKIYSQLVHFQDNTTAT